jgi:hypothetical protein
MPRPLTLKAKGRKPLDLGPRVRLEGAHATPPAAEASLPALLSGAGLRDLNKDGFKEHDTSPKDMWRADDPAGLTLEFELPETVPLSAIEVWNFNAEWQTTNGLRQADIAISPDGSTWQTVLPAAQFAEADGRPDYDEPVVLKLSGAKARKVRFEKMTPWGAGGKVGLSKVVFHQAPGAQAAPLQPEDGATSVNLGKASLKWTSAAGAKEHKVYLGTAADKLEPLGATSDTHLDAPGLKPDIAYFWRVDAVQPDGSVVSGRIARFATSGLVGWWKLDETKGSKAEDASGHQLTGNVVGKPQWAPGEGRMGGAMEFDGKSPLINCGKAPEFDFTDVMTVAAWIKVRQFDKEWQAIVTKGDTAWRLQRDGQTGAVAFDFDSPKPSGGKTVVRLVSKQNVDDGQWHHVVGLADGRRVALYLDGKLQDSGDAKPIAQNTQSVMIGCNSEYYDRRFNGWIDDVRLYGYGLSDDDVKALYRAAAAERAAEK